MSEKRAKRERKELEAVKPVVKKSNKGAILSNIVIVVVIAAIAGLGIFATKDKLATVFTTTDVAQEQQVQTVADIAESEGMTAEELLEKCGMTDLGLTAESTADDQNRIRPVRRVQNDTRGYDYAVKRRTAWSICPKHSAGNECIRRDPFS